MLKESPTFANGKICYIEIPATNVERSADFYRRAFGWNIRKRDDGSFAFDDGVNEVSGTWVTGRPPATQPGFTIYVMVADIARTLDNVVEAGGELVQPVRPDAKEVYALVRDPAGNVLGVYQGPELTSSAP